MRISKHLATVGILSLALATVMAAMPAHPALAHGGDIVTINSTVPSNTLCGSPLSGDVSVTADVDFSSVKYDLYLTDSTGTASQLLQEIAFSYSSLTFYGGVAAHFGFSYPGSVPDGSWLKLTVTAATTDVVGVPQTSNALVWQCHGYIGTPNVPAGFVQRQITCTTRLYWGADPKATVNGNNYLIQGQSWYVSPTAVKGTDGNQWTPVYIGSFDLVYIPTNCAFQTQVVVNSTPPPNVAQANTNTIAYSFPTGLHS